MAAGIYSEEAGPFCSRSFNKNARARIPVIAMIYHPNAGCTEREGAGGFISQINCWFSDKAFRPSCWPPTDQVEVDPATRGGQRIQIISETLVVHAAETLRTASTQCIVIMVFFCST